MGRFGFELLPAIASLTILASGCATAHPKGLVVRAALKEQGVLPVVSCDIPADRRSGHGLPVLRVLTIAPCTTKAKVVVFAFDEQKTLLQKTYLERLQPRQERRFELELAEELPQPGTDITVLVWTRCDGGEPQQGVDTCQIPR